MNTPLEDDREVAYEVIARRSRKTAILLALTLGWLGVHRFYLGQYVRGLLCVLFAWTTVPFFLSIYDAMEYWSMTPLQFIVRFNPTIALKASELSET